MFATPAHRSSFAMAACLLVGVVAAACGEVDPTPGAATTDSGSSWYDTGSDDDTGPISRTDGFGTQVGSEGFWGCIITERTPLGGDDLLPDSAVSVSKAAEGLTGGWVLDYDVDGTLEAGGLWLDPATDPVLVDTECGSYVEARVEGQLDRGDASVVVNGLLALTADERAIRVAAPSSQGDVREAWGDPVSPDLTFLRTDLKLDLDSTTLGGGVDHANCLLASCTQTMELALAAGTR